MRRIQRNLIHSEERSETCLLKPEEAETLCRLLFAAGGTSWLLFFLEHIELLIELC